MIHGLNPRQPFFVSYRLKMNTTYYKIVFKGVALSGYDIDTVKNNFALLCRIPVQQAESLFNGQEITLKKGLSYEQAQQYLASFNKRGIHVTVLAETASPHFEAVDQQQAVHTPKTPPVFSDKSTQQIRTHQNTGSGKDHHHYYDSPKGLSSVEQTFSENDGVVPPPLFSKSFEGRYGRLNFANAYIVIISMQITAFIILFLLEYTETIKKTPSILVIFLAIGWIVFSARIYGLRLRDMNISEWFYAPIFVIPFVMQLVFRMGLYSWLFHLSVLVLMLSIPGTRGQNKYGAVSRPGSPAGLIILVVLGGAGLLLSLFALPFIAALSK